MAHDLCSKKEVCGSCGWSHIPYEKQLQQKISDINGSFKLKGLDISCTKILPSPRTEHYRNRMDFVIGFDGKVGLREKGKWWRVIDDHTCFIADEKIEKLFTITRNWTQTAKLPFYDRKAHTGLLRYAIIRTTSRGESMVIILTSTPTEEEKPRLLQALAELADTAQPTTLIWSINTTISDVSFGTELHTITGDGYITENINEFLYRITPNAFFQTNFFASPLLQKIVMEYAKQTHPQTIVDLFCGSGFFTMPLARLGKKTVGVELVEEAIHDARINAELNKLDIEFFAEKTENFAWSEYTPDLLILDPPRSGMHDSVLEKIQEESPKNIIYISCNYKNFAREMKILEKIYRVQDMTAIDMFPHTPHVELVSWLQKK